MDVLYCISLIVVTGLARWVLGAWSAPAAAYCLVWTIAVIPAILVIPEFISPLAVALVVSFMLAALVGSLTVEMMRRPGPVTHAMVIASSPEATGRQRFDGGAIALLVLGCCGLGTASYYLLTSGFSLSDFASGETWVQLAIKNTVARYQGEETEPFAIRILLALNYGGALLAGISFARRVTPGVRLVSILPLIAGVIITLVTTAKTSAMLCFLFAFEAWLAARVVTIGEKKSTRWSRRLLLPAAALGLVAAFAGSLALRYGEGADAELLVTRSSSYLIGQMPAMSAWLAVDDWSNAPKTLGLYTFAGAFEMLGGSQRAPGLYDPIGLNDWSAESNIYSALRGLIIDFGLPAAWLIIAAVTGAAQSCWSRLRAGGGWPLATLFLTAYYAFAFWTPIVSIFSYNVVWLAFAVYAALIWRFKQPPPAPAPANLAVSATPA